MYCRECGYENKDDAPFCENCGAELNSFYRENALDGVSRKHILLIVVAAIILVIGISVFFILGDYSQTDKSDPRASNLVCPYCGAGPNTMVAVRENSTHINWYCQYCDNTWWEPIS